MVDGKWITYEAWHGRFDNMRPHHYSWHNQGNLPMQDWVLWRKALDKNTNWLFLWALGQMNKPIFGYGSLPQQKTVCMNNLTEIGMSRQWKVDAFNE
jgi:hypothetical protein